MVKFHVGDAAAGTPGHGDTIATGAIGVATVEVHLTRAARSEYGCFSAVGDNAILRSIVDISTYAAHLAAG